MNDVVFRLLRELPDTDRDRYDIAYGRGRAQARSALLFGGIAIGLVAGGLGLFLLDPVVGTGRRAQLAQRAKAALVNLRDRTMGAATKLGLPATPQGNVERLDAAADAAAAPTHEVRTPPRSAAASVVQREGARDRVPVAAGTEER